MRVFVVNFSSLCSPIRILGTVDVPTKHHFKINSVNYSSISVLKKYNNGKEQCNIRRKKNVKGTNPLDYVVFYALAPLPQ